MPNPRPQAPNNNAAFRSAWWKGYHTGGAGLSSNTCPYEDIRTPQGHVTFSRAFIHAWHVGWQVGNDARRERGLMHTPPAAQ